MSITPTNDHWLVGVMSYPSKKKGSMLIPGGFIMAQARNDIR